MGDWQPRDYGWRQVSCDYCHAQPGERCVTRNGGVTLPHLARIVRGNGLVDLGTPRNP